jgi:hypothetical protein
MSASQQNSPSLTPRLRPANFGEDQGESHGDPGAHKVPERISHWSLEKRIDPSKFLALFGHLPHRFSATNYVSWMCTSEATLDTIDMLKYINGTIPVHKSSHMDYANWRAANTLVRSILMTNMAEEVAVQMSHLRNAAKIWNKARRLFSGQTMTDFTLTITSLVTTKFVDGEDPATHIVKMMGYRCNLMLMNHDLDDSLFACFLRISMPPTWNYVFTGLPQLYTSAEVEHQIKDGHSIKTNQESVAIAYRAMQTNGKLHDHLHNGNEPHCMNCNKPGHWISGCWSKGGGAKGKGPRQKKRQHKKKNDEMESKNKKKGKD